MTVRSAPRLRLETWLQWLLIQWAVASHDDGFLALVDPQLQGAGAQRGPDAAVAPERLQVMLARVEGEGLRMGPGQGVLGAIQT